METDLTPEQQWFDEAGLGLFVHWGLSAVHGGVELSWGMVRDKPWDDDDELPTEELSPEEYFALAEEFDPDAFAPDEWLATAREAGMEYAVLTAKHHDGFALWPSEHGEFSTAQYCDGRDLVGEFVAACRRQGLKAGLYFSLPDWHHPDFPRPETYDDLEEAIPQYRVGSRHRHVDDPVVSREGPPLADVEELRRFESYLAFAKGQLRELLTWYGRIDLLWFDNPLWRESLDHRMEGIYDLVRAAQPGIVVNGRTGYTAYGDYQTPERRVPDRPLDTPWELAQTWGSSWGYTAGDDYRDLAWTLDVLSRTVARGGNLLLNVGPRADGSLPAPAGERLSELAAWARHSGHTVTDVERGPWPERADIPVTRREGVWYLHVPVGHETVAVRDVPPPESVRLVRTDDSLAFEHENETENGDGDEGDLTVTVPGDVRAGPDEVVAVSWSPAVHHLL